jgi:hypothetical protein
MTTSRERSRRSEIRLLVYAATRLTASVPALL